MVRDEGCRVGIPPRHAVDRPRPDALTDCGGHRDEIQRRPVAIDVGFRIFFDPAVVVFARGEQNHRPARMMREPVRRPVRDRVRREPRVIGLRDEEERVAVRLNDHVTANRDQDVA